MNTRPLTPRPPAFRIPRIDQMREVFIPVNSGESLAIAGCSGFASNVLASIAGYFTATG